MVYSNWFLKNRIRRNSNAQKTLLMANRAIIIGLIFHPLVPARGMGMKPTPTVS